jgi:hypothetical protein
MRKAAGTGLHNSVSKQGTKNSELPVRLGSIRGSKHPAGWFPCTKETRKGDRKMEKVY